MNVPREEEATETDSTIAAHMAAVTTIAAEAEAEDIAEIVTDTMIAVIEDLTAAATATITAPAAMVDVTTATLEDAMEEEMTAEEAQAPMDTIVLQEVHQPTLRTPTLLLQQMLLQELATMTTDTLVALKQLTSNRLIQRHRDGIRMG
jgi:hypothetical protein